MRLKNYDRNAAVSYARAWAFGRNPNYYNFDGLGGDCTNFVSQCIFAGAGVMNYSPVFGWYYISSDNRAPSWTGVEFLGDFL
ncbi:MAG: amidase domain-containing protein, partial [Clostridia bacterium]|nr:amidase domain-containing protein [Clostridia bacterium]